MKKLTTMLMAGVLAAGGTITAYADTAYKTAALNDAKVRFNDGEVQTIQCYNIDGYNFVRARDITNELGVAVYAIQSGTAGVMVDPHSHPTSKNEAEKLTQQTAQVKVEKGELIYDGSVSKAECFLLNGRYYFKLADFADASRYAEEGAIELVNIEAKSGIAEEPFMPAFYGIDIEWNEKEKMIDVTYEMIDLAGLFQDIRGGKVISVEQNFSKEDNNKAAGVRVQEPLTAAPKVGTFLADILIDENAGAYVDDEMKTANTDNYTAAYAYADAGMIGQCTWYAKGRLVETTGLDIAANRFVGVGVNNWVKKAQSDSCPNVDGITDPKAIQPRSIVTWDGHTAFVEWVDYDDKGNPVTVYFTEANANHRSTDRISGAYYPDFDGMVKKMSFDDFINRNEFIGYVVVK